MKREIYTSDDLITLCLQIEEDNEAFEKMNAQLYPEFIARFGKYAEETVWNSISSLKKNYYSIFEKDGSYCGNIEVEIIPTKTPEIGICLAKEKQNRGIAIRAIKLLARKAYEENNIDYFILKAKETNMHSRHMMEKLGAEFIGKENFNQKLSDEIFQVIDSMGAEDFPDLHGVLNDEFIEKGEIIYVYKLTPNAFI